MSMFQRTFIVMLAALAGALIAASPAHGALITIANAGFENVQIANGDYSNSSANHPDWTRVGAGAYTGVANPPAGDATLIGSVVGGFGGPTEGEQYGWAVNGLGLQQTIAGATFDASENYVLRVDAALSSYTLPANANVGYIITFHLETGILLGQLEFSSDEDNIKDGVFRTRTLNYIGGTQGDGKDGLEMTIRLQSFNFGPIPDRYGAAFDNIRLESSPVPEPAATAGALLSLGVLALRRRPR